MKKTVITVFKKELKRFFSDRKTAVMTVIMPGILIYIMYSFMGSAMTGFISGDSVNYDVKAVNLPAFVSEIFKDADVVFSEITQSELQSAKEEVKNGDGCAAVITFPEAFESAVAEYDVASGKQAPLIEIYYNSSSTDSQAAFTVLNSVLGGYESAICNKFDINTGSEVYDVADDESVTGMMFSLLLPMLLMIFLFSGCMAVGVESVAGEKERGTVATLLVTPVKRSHIVIGKLLALALIALMSGASSAIGTFVSLPKLFGGEEFAVSGSVYTFADYALLAAVILSTVMVLITLIAIVSTLSKSMKEAQTYVLPFMILNMAVGISGMFGGAKENAAFYLIPLYNSVQSMVSIFSFSVSYLNIFVTVAANLLTAALGVFVLTRLFNSEKVMFSK